MKGSKVRAGAAQIDISPKRGTQLDGDLGRYRPTEIVLDPVFAKALVIESDGRKLCILSLDACMVTEKWASKIRHTAKEKFGFAYEAVMVHALQNHSATSLGLFFLSEDCPYVPEQFPWLRGGGYDSYSEYALPRIIEAIERAMENLEDAFIGTSRGIDGRVAFNRRYVMRNGESVMLPGKGNPDILYVEGPSDPEVGVMCITTESARPLAMLLHHTCHPVHGFHYHQVTAGWPGAWSNEAKQLYGQTCVPLVINGCCGNVFHDNHLDPDFIDDYRRMGRLLMETTDKAIKRMTYLDSVQLNWATKKIQIPKRVVGKEELEAAQQLISRHPEPVWLDAEQTNINREWYYAVATLDLYENTLQEPDYDYEIQAFRIGDTALLALGGEPFVECQLKIKLESASKYTFVAHMSNHYAGYIPTKEAFKRGGYETKTANWSKLAPEAIDLVADASVQLIQELWGRGK